jgi:NADP-dependent 3-hydroxy acid dehydrogenase YdfG
MDLQGKTAIVTGTSRGIGKAITLNLLKNGVTVAGWGLHEPEFNNDHFTFFKTDMQSKSDIDASYDKTLKALGGKVHILINNAGLGYFGSFEEMPQEQYHQMMRTNVDGVFFATQAVIPVMKKQKTGHIVNISSIAGLEANKLVVAYAATKFAVHAFTQGLFKELRDYGIKVTGIYPGSVKTDFFQNAQGIDAHDYMMKPEEIAASVMHTLTAPENYLVNQVVMRPLHPKGPPDNK